jgi:PKD repeat protein
VSSANVTSWSWDFGDGSGAQERNPRHTYTLPGLYSVRLAVTSPTGSSHLERTGWVEVFVPAPVAAFELSPSTGVAPFTAVFVERSSGAIDEWIWDFGDGSSSRKRAPTHVYGSPGLYSVTLTVIGPGGSDSLTRSNGVEVLAAPPVAGLTAAPTSGIAPLAVQFGDLSTGAITGWSWDFGDGAGSALASPQHTYTTPGTYSVVLTVRGPGGTDTESRADLVSVQHAPPVADFSATPRDGFAPLAVTFGDLSSGAIDTWSWTFGDGSSSSVPSPTHVFLTPGSYPVVLRVAGPGGESSRQRTIVARAAPLFADGSFELQTSGLEPVSPWRVFRGNNTRIRPAAGEPLFAADGLLLCDLGAEGSANALPPSNPGGAGTPAFGLAGLEQSFLFPMDAPHLFFEAAFLRNGPARSTSTNDFMSVDIGDGTTIWNLWFADSFADFPLVSAVHALPMTAPERVHVDLAALFPNADASTVLTLRFGVGNHGNGAAPSRGLIDGFRFEPAASATFRNGRGLNPALYVASPAVIGGQFTVTIDGGQRPAAGFARVLGRQNPLAGTPLLGGELLIGGKPLFTLALPLRGTSASLTLPMPADPSLVGLRAATQAVLFGGGLTLSNAFDLRLGY